MHSTALTWVQVPFLTIALVAIFGLYFWKIRPLIRHQVEFISAETWFIWLKSRWDVVTAVVVATIPVAWNGILDLIVLFSTADLSSVIIPTWLKTTIQIAAIAAPLIRLRVEANKAA